MPLLSLSDGCLAFGHVPLLDHADFQLDAGERVALIGRNGTGKSSLLRALAGQSRLDDGEVWIAPGSHVAYVSQEPDFPLTQSIYDTVAQGCGDVAQLLIKYHEATQAMTQAPAAEHDAWLERIAELQHQLEMSDGWRLNNKVEHVLQRLHLLPEQLVSQLSGGGIKRVQLARALVGSPDLLLLDEPTNHLDLDGILWLEELIRDFSGAVVVITHDRQFMDRMATRIVELDRGYLSSYPGTFAEYQKRKAEQLAAESLENARFDKFLAQEEVWIRKGVEARRTRNEGRVKRLEQLRRDRAARRERIGKVNFQLDRGEKSGQMVAELHQVYKRFADKEIVKDFSTRILRGDRVGLIGPNGAGKTTLLKLILGQLQPDAGQIRTGARLTVAYYDQLRTQLDPEAPLTQVISPGSDYVEIGSQRKHVIGYLEDFLFSPARARSPVKSLSGGERNRLLMARLFARPANVLVLDEPTNDLDIETLELLESLLADYDGTVFLVSHDRAFLDNVATQVIAAEGNGAWGEYAGGYEDWLRCRPQPTSSQVPSVSQSGNNKPEAATAVAARRSSTRPDKLSFKEKRELEQLPARIAALETEQTNIQAQLADPALYRERPQDVASLKERVEEIELELLNALERWEALEARQA